MMDFQDNISDFKSTSLDLLYNQVSSLIASYNELKASGEINDVFEKRLLLLQKTIGSMKSLIQNVEEFNDLDEDVTEKMLLLMIKIVQLLLFLIVKKIMSL